MKKILNKKFAIILLVGLLGGFYIYHEKGSYSVVMNGREFELEIAKTSEQRRMGLGNRDGICNNCGMLFEFSQKGQYNFWMKDMNFPLDIIWISDGKIVQLEKNVESDFGGVLKSKFEADKVIEINAGKSDEIGLKVGSNIAF